MHSSPSRQNESIFHANLFMFFICRDADEDKDDIKHITRIIDEGRDNDDETEDEY
jgi:hypothetical protein